MTLEELMPKISGDKAASYYIANVLREAIYRGVLEENEQLLQNQLAARMGVSPIPLREALKQLEIEGLVEFRGRRGAIVSGLTLDDAREIYDMLIWLETGVMRVAFDLISNALIQDEEKLLDEMEKETDTVKWRDMNVLFHSSLYEPADRPQTLDMIAKLRRQVDRYIRTHLNSMRKESEEQHREILNCVKNHDLEGAIKALESHLVNTSKDLQAYMRHHQNKMKDK
ncbi:MAG: GntR family transcriptional regulator [Pyramidobacter sp.]|nr:GntR family transcriptional regulator [Pyramidobacter sp.]